MTDWRILRWDETALCGEGWIRERRIRETGVFYLYDHDRHVHLCEFTPSLELWAIDSYVLFDAPDVDEETCEAAEQEARDAMWEQEICYVHVVDVAGKPWRPLREFYDLPEREPEQDDEAYYQACVEAVREHLSGNPPWFDGLPAPRPGDRVHLARVRHPEFRGRTATVKRYFKTKGEVLVSVRWIDGREESYRAKVENVDVVACPGPVNVRSCLNVQGTRP